MKFKNNTICVTAIISLCGLIACMMLAAPAISFAATNDPEKLLIVYYSRTGNCRLVSETLQKQIGGTIREIKDLEDRSGTLGYWHAGFDAFFDRGTTIEPAQVDLSPYSLIIVVSPVWNWKLSTPIRTFFNSHRFDGKKVILFTTANNDIRKYEQYDDTAPFIKRYFRDYIRGKSKTSRDYVIKFGGDFIKHCHLETLDKSNEQIINGTLQQISTIKAMVFPIVQAKK